MNSDFGLLMAARFAAVLLVNSSFKAPYLTFEGSWFKPQTFAPSGVNHSEPMNFTNDTMQMCLVRSFFSLRGRLGPSWHSQGQVVWLTPNC